MSVHLVVLIHGLYGSPANLSVIKEEIINAGADQPGPSPPEIVVLVCKSFSGSHTWDGIDVNAFRASKEIDQAIEDLVEAGKTVDHFSIVGYSLGGRESFWTVARHDLIMQWSGDI
jgi:pimeloyl-ACP methyl ester carboxylesterase